MTTDQALSPKIWPEPFVWSNYTDVFDQAPMFRYALNTMIYSVLATLGMLISSIPVAYALALLRWRGRQLAFLLVLVAMMLLAPVIIPNWFGDAFSIFLLRQFFLTIPEPYLDSARVDGCGELKILLTVVLRLAKPAIAAVALFMFLLTFSDFFGPLLYAGDDEAHWTLSVGLAQFRTLHQVQWNLTMAATILVITPVIVLFFFAQKAFVEGVTLTGVKE
jgi:multiple sugar transport system permease protein